MENKQIISIIIPVYNTEKYLRKCLDSIVNQTFRNLEIVCIDDGSTDGSLLILKEYQQKDSRIKIVEQKNSGLSSARNTGIKNSTAELISFIDSDDFIEINTYEKIISHIDDHIDMIQFGAKLVIEVEDNKMNPEYFRVKESGIMSSNFDVLNQLNVTSWSKIFRRSIINKYEIDFPQGLLYEDWCFFWKYSAVINNIFFITDELYNYLIRNNSIMSDTFNGLGSGKAIHNLECFKNVYIFLEKWNLLDKYPIPVLFMNSFNFAYYFSNKKEKINVLKESTKIVRILELNKKYPKDKIFKKLYKKQYHKISGVNFYTKLQKIFSLKKEQKKIVFHFFGKKFQFIKTKKVTNESIINKIENISTDINKSNDLKNNQIIELNQVITELNQIIINKNKSIESLQSDIIEFSSYIRKPIFNDNKEKLLFFSQLNFKDILSHHLYLPYVLQITNDIDNANAIFVWGMRNNFFESVQVSIRNNIPLYYVEDGFIRSIYPYFVKCDPILKSGISFTVDSRGMYFDATKSTDLEYLLNDYNMTEDELIRSRKNICKITSSKISKYNHQPLTHKLYGRPNKTKILVVDQSYQDASVYYGLADDDTFNKMLYDAIKDNPDADILLKIHPDTIAKGENSSYFNEVKGNNIFIINEDINPFILIEQVSKVYVCSSQLGFEALMCNKDVYTYGLPFYAGWGLTKDQKKCTRRKRLRTIEELFFITYIVYSHYFNPETKEICEIEASIDYLIKLRDSFK